MFDPRKPVKIVGVENDPEHVIVNSAGEVRAAPLIILDEESVGRIRAGYVCAKCFEPQTEAFPEQCYLCKFPMRDKQAEFVGKAYQGTVRVGPSTSLEDEEAFMNEWAEIQARKQDRMPRTPSIWVPRGI